MLLPPINGATAFTGAGTCPAGAVSGQNGCYFSENPNVNGTNKFAAWDMQVTLDYMPRPFFTWRTEYTHRAASVPYFTGPNGVTPPGGNTGGPGSTVPGWYPDLVNSEDRITMAMLIKY